VLGSKPINKRNIETAIVELFTKGGRPFTMIDDKAFKVLVAPVLDAANIKLNRHNIADRISAYLFDVKENIKVELKRKRFSLKIDAATRHGYGLLGVNAQFIKDGEVVIRTLAIKELKSGHTGAYLKSVVTEVLNDYAVEMKQILTITTDNGANMLKAVSDLNAKCNALMMESDFLETPSVDTSIDETLQSLRARLDADTITNVRCGAHTLQLVASNVFSQQEIKRKLGKIRSVVIKLRTPSSSLR